MTESAFVDRDMIGTVFDIQHFSLDDGPGIRTTVFLKGCPLRCQWCHNPEGLEAHSQIMYYTNLCTGCERCVNICPEHCHIFSKGQHFIDYSSCVACGLCTTTCYTRALKLVGARRSVGDVLDEVLKDKVFYDQSGGGMTLSGGEPLFQPHFTEALLRAAKHEGLHTCIDTSGCCTEDALEKAARFTDLFLFDIKETDTERHQLYTGVSNTRILKNLYLLDSLNKSVVLSCPIIPGRNDRAEHMQGIARLANDLRCVTAIKLEPYHPLGVDKSQALGKTASYANAVFLNREAVEPLAEVIRNMTTIPVTIT